jgi:hypothetical protein
LGPSVTVVAAPGWADPDSHSHERTSRNPAKL